MHQSIPKLVISPAKSALQHLETLGQEAALRKQTQAPSPHWLLKSARLGSFGLSLNALLFWVLFSPPVAMEYLYNRVLFIPETENVTYLKELRGLPIENVFFKSQNGALLNGLYIQNPEAKKTIIISHGNGGNMMHSMHLAAISILAGASVFLYDYQGYGKSAGKPTLPGVVSDAVAAYDYVNLKRHVAADNIVLMGNSLGTGVASQLSKCRQVSAMILIAAYRDILSAGRQKLAWLNLYPDSFFPKQILNTAEVLSKPHPKTLLIHGELDMTIPVQHARDLAKNAVGDVELIIVAQGDHNNSPVMAAQKVINAVHKYLQ